MSEKSLEQITDEAPARCLANYEASQRAVPPTPEEEIAQRLSEARFRERFGDHAMAAGAIPGAIRHLMRDAETIFELKDGTFTEPYLFLPPTSEQRH